MFSRTLTAVKHSTAWILFSVTALGCCTGVLSLLVAACSDSALPWDELFRFYFTSPVIVFLNLLPPVILLWIFYLLTRRAWLAFLASSVPVLLVSVVNYYKIQLRSDPFLAVDLRLVSEAGNVAGGYTLDLVPVILSIPVFLVIGTVLSLVLIPRAPWRLGGRLLAAAGCTALAAFLMVSVYLNPDQYRAIPHPDFVNGWSDVEMFLSRGCTYPFLYSCRNLSPSPPDAYSPEDAEELLNSLPDSDIPEDRKVSILGVMLEAFSDFTDFPALAEDPLVQEVYAPWHELERQSVSGDLLTNIFGGGTVDTEWGFVSGYSTHEDFRKNTDSYVWYLRDQGYQTFGSHPGYEWFYNRKNVNRYLGFQEYWFSENHYASLVDPVLAQFHSDQILAQELLHQMQTRIRSGPCFSFSVSYQNHGPYTAEGSEYHHVSDTLNLTDSSRSILNTYLNGVAETGQAMKDLADGLEQMSEPGVLVLFGDHKPWGGNGNSVYRELNVNFDTATAEGMRQYYSTPYLIWANSAARKCLGTEFTGRGLDLSPCFLLPQVFHLCGWEGPGFMKLAWEVCQVTPMVHTQGLYWVDGGPTDSLPPEDMDLVNLFTWVEYYREHNVSVGSPDASS